MAMVGWEPKTDPNDREKLRPPIVPTIGSCKKESQSALIETSALDAKASTRFWRMRIE